MRVCMPVYVALRARARVPVPVPVPVRACVCTPLCVRVHACMPVCGRCTCRYVELLEKDCLRFGYSSREYVLLNADKDNQ